MTDHDDNLDGLRAEVARLQSELAAVRRALRQAERTAARSEAMSLQSKRAMLRTHRELEIRVDELGSAKLAAEEGSRAKDRFLATMSHELRTPLNGMVGSAELLMGTELTGEQEELVGLLQRSGIALLTIVNEVLDFSRLQANRMPIDRIPFRIFDCVNDVVGLQRHVAEEKRLGLRLDLADDLPKVVFGDPGRLRQVLMNLITNALKFTIQGHVELRVARGQREDEIVFRVSDTGIGISAEAQPRLFDAFSQADASTTREFGGTGLGLAVSRKLAKLMGGNIHLASVAGQGSTFQLSALLPETSESELESQGDEPAVMAKPDGSSPAGGRVLVVDDNPSNRLIVSRMLTRLGFKSETATDGVDAVACASSHDYQLVLMDCSMPVMDGYDATVTIRGLPGHRATVPILALTANTLPEDKERCRAVGMDGYLSKPVRLEELKAAIDRALGQGH